MYPVPGFSKRYADKDSRVTLYFEKEYSTWIFANEPGNMSTVICYSQDVGEHAQIKYLILFPVICNMNGNWKEYNDLRIINNEC